MTITLNGVATEVADRLTVAELLVRAGLGEAPRGVAVAIGETVVRRPDWATTVLQPGDVVEIVTAAQGG
jgi:sulfur carrier protein